MKKNVIVKYFNSPGKLGLCINCNKKNCANCSMGSFSETIHKFASTQQVSKVNTDFRYIRFRAIGSLEVDGPNCNSDGFPYGEFLNFEPGYGYQSFVGKHAFVEHQSDDITKSIGSLLGSYLNRFDTSKYGREWNDLTSEERIDILNNRKSEEDGSIEVLMGIDSKLAPAIARMVETDSSVGCSMGTNIIYSTCSVCGNEARFESEYCGHIAFSKGNTILVPANQIRNLLKEGKLRPEWLKWVLKREADQKEVLHGKISRMVTATVFEINYGLSFFELSVVANPAYIRGYKLEKIASLLKEGFQQLLPFVKVGEDEVELHIDVTNEYFNASTNKKAKELNKDFDNWSNLEKVSYLRDGDIAKDALKTNQVQKIYVETENRSKLEKVGAKFESMDNPTFVQIINPEVLLNLTFAEKDSFMKFSATEMIYKGTGLDLFNVKDFENLISREGKQPQELVDYMYELAGKDEKKINDINDYIKMLQVKYKVVPREYKIEEKKLTKGLGGEKMANKITQTDVRQDSAFMKKIDQLSASAQEEFVGAYTGAYNYKIDEGVICRIDAEVYAARTAWSKVPESQKESFLVNAIVKKAVYDSLPTTVEEPKDEGIEIEKTELKTWKNMSDEGGKMIEKEKKERPHGVIFLEDSVSASKVVRDTLGAIRSLKKQVVAAIKTLAGELPPGLKEYMERKREEKGEKPEEKPGDIMEKPEGKKGPVEKLEEKPGEKKEEKKPETVKQILENTITDLKEVHMDLENAEKELTEKVEKPLEAVLNGTRRYGRNLKLAVEEILKEVKPVIEDASEAVGEAESIIKDTIEELKKVEKPSTDELKKEEKPETKKEDKGGEIVPDELDKTLANAAKIKKAHEQLTAIFGEKTATSMPPTGAKDPGDYGEPPVAKELATWKGFYQEYEKIKDKEKRTEFDTPEGRIDLLTGIVAKLFLNREKVGDSYWLITKKSNDFAIKSTFVNVAEGNMTKDNFKKFCSASYKLAILKAVSNVGLEDTRREMFGSWVKVKTKTAAEFEGKKIDKVPQELYDTREKDKASGEKRDGVEPTDAKASVNEKGYYSDAFGDAGYAKELTKEALVKENAILKRKLSALEADKIADTLAKRAVDLARKAAAVGAIPFTAEDVTEKAKEYAVLDPNSFEAVTKTLDSLPVVNAKALTAYQIPEAENVNSGIVYDATDSVRKVRIEDKKPDELKIENMKFDVEDAARLAKKADLFEEIPPVDNVSRFEEVYKPETEEIEVEEEILGEVSADVQEKIRKKASVVPQLKTATVNLQGTKIPDFTGQFTTIENTLRKKGIKYNPPIHRYRR